MQYVTLPEQSAVTIGNVWTQIILKTEQNSSVFVRKRISVDRALGEYSKVWRVTLGLVLTNPFSKRSASTLIVFVSFSPVHTTTSYPFWKCCYTLSAHAQMNWTHAHFNISAREIGAKSHMVAPVLHFGYSRSSGLAPGRVYFDDVTVFR